MKNTPFILALCLSFILTAGLAQESQTEPNLDNGTVDEQYDFLVKRGGNYNANGIRYEVIRIGDLTKFKSNISDSLDIAGKTIVQLKNTIAENSNEIQVLNTKLNETTETLNTLMAEKDSMSFFGTQVSKTTYRGIVWGIIFALALALALFIYKYRTSNFLTVQAKSALAELEAEYEQHRRRSLEREQKISRELHDERNKNKKS